MEDSHIESFLNEKLKLYISGAKEASHCGVDAYEKALALGRAVADSGAILLSGTAAGFPCWAAIGAQKAGGMSIGFSPAATEAEHIHSYGLTVEYADFIVYTGLGHSGFSLITVRSADAVFIGCGRGGTIEEFRIAYGESKPIGILEGEWTTDEVIQIIIEGSNLDNDKIVLDSDPKVLVKRTIELVRKGKEQHVYKNDIGIGERKSIVE